MDTGRVIVIDRGPSNPDAPPGYGRYRRIRIWLGDVPEAAYPAGETLVRTMSVSPTTRAPARRRVTIEWYLQLCHGWYACLGADFEPAPGDVLRIEVVTVCGPGQVASWALIPDPTNALIGLAAEFATSVIDAATHESARSPLGGGTLRFDRAVHDKVQSSEGLFQALTLACIRLLARAPDDLTDDETGNVVYSAVPSIAKARTNRA